MALVSALFFPIRRLIISRTARAAENLALRQQLAVLNPKIRRPRLRRRDLFFWAPHSTLDELTGGLDHRQTGDRHQMANRRYRICSGETVADWPLKKTTSVTSNSLATGFGRTEKS
jgi:hypothetical protein